MKKRKRAKPGRRDERLLLPDRYTVSGVIVGDFCLECECRVVEVGGPEGMTFAWCDCVFPEDHHEMEVL